MKLSIEYLNQRHNYWLKRIGETGIWNATQFHPVQFVIRKNHRRYNAVFQRRTSIINGERKTSDKIIFYNKVPDFNAQFVDNVLVHEMIHQYIIQNDIKDSSAHGVIFKSFMNKINIAFPFEIQIRIKDQNPDIPLSGPSETTHTLLLLHMKNQNFICAVINPKKISHFQHQLKTNAKLWGINSHEWAESNDSFFERFSRCTTRLHGIAKSEKELDEFRRQYNIKSVKETTTVSQRKRRFRLPFDFFS